MTTPPKTKHNSHSPHSHAGRSNGEGLSTVEIWKPQIFRPIATFLSECVALIPQPVPNIGTGTSSSARLRALAHMFVAEPASKLDRIWRLEIAPAKLLEALARRQRVLSRADFGQQAEYNNQPDQCGAHLSLLPVGDHQPNHAAERGEQHDQPAYRDRAILQYRPDHSGPPALVESHNAWMTLWQMLEATSGIFFGVFPKSVGRFA